MCAGACWAWTCKRAWPSTTTRRAPQTRARRGRWRRTCSSRSDPDGRHRDGAGSPPPCPSRPTVQSKTSPPLWPFPPVPQSFLTLAKPEGVGVGADCGVWTLLFMRALVHQLAFGDDLRLPTELAIAQTPRAMRCEAQELIERLAFAAQPTPTPLPDVPVLALDGASGSGKSSCIADLERLIAADLHGAVHLIVLHQDDYFLVRLHKHQPTRARRPRPPGSLVDPLIDPPRVYRDKATKADWTTPERNWDSPEAIDWPRYLAAIDAARADPVAHCTACAAASSAQPPTAASMVRPPTAASNARPQHWLLLEGFLTLWHTDVRNRTDLALFLDCPKAVCAARRAARHWEGVHGTDAPSARDRRHAPPSGHSLVLREP